MEREDGEIVLAQGAIAFTQELAEKIASALGWKLEYLEDESVFRLKTKGYEIELETGGENKVIDLAKSEPCVHVLIDGVGGHGAVISINHVREIVEVGQGVRFVRSEEEYVDVTRDGAVEATFISAREEAA